MSISPYEFIGISQQVECGRYRSRFRTAGQAEAYRTPRKYLFRTPEMQDQLLGNIRQILYCRGQAYNAEADP